MLSFDTTHSELEQASSAHTTTIMAANQNQRIIPLEDGWNDVKQVRHFGIECYHRDGETLLYVQEYHVTKIDLDVGIGSTPNARVGGLERSKLKIVKVFAVGPHHHRCG